VATSIWNVARCEEWAAALAAYPAQVAAVGDPKLVVLDDWYRDELPAAIVARRPAHVTRDELVRVVEWKMRRGAFRPRNLALARSNSDEAVETASGEAFERAGDVNAAIRRLGILSGIGPATASAVLAAFQPERYPFFDDVVAGAIPDFGAVKFSIREYLDYAARLQERAALLAVGCPAGGWTPELVGRALWSAAGGKPR
jgi:anti-sigma factor RsiW